VKNRRSKIILGLITKRRKKEGRMNKIVQWGRVLGIILTIFSLKGFAQERDSVIFNDCISNYLNNFDQYQTYYKKRFIPKVLRKEIENIDSEKFRIANPNQKFRATDVVRNPFLPTRRLKFIAQYGEDYVLFYEHGGRGYHLDGFFVKIVNGKIQNICGVAMWKIDKPESIKNKLRSKGTYLVTYINGRRTNYSNW
jgi:hypothetical protein